MTDYSELRKRLRTLKILDEVGSDNPLGRDAADAIEALQARAEKAEANYSALNEMFVKRHERLEKANGFIEELAKKLQEAQMQRDALTKALDTIVNGPYPPEVEDGISRSVFQTRTARDALDAIKGESRD